MFCAVLCCAKLLQLCLTFCDPMYHSPPGSSVPEALQARILECVGVHSSRGSSPPRNWTHISHLLDWQVGSLPLVPPRSLYIIYNYQQLEIIKIFFNRQIDKVCVLFFILFMISIVSLNLTVHTVHWIHTRHTLRLEEDVRNHKNCRHIYSLLADTAAIA